MELNLISLWIHLVTSFEFLSTENCQVMLFMLKWMKWIWDEKLKKACILLFELQHLKFPCCNIYSASGLGSSSNAAVSVQKLIMLAPGKNTLDLLSATVGLQVLLNLLSKESFFPPIYSAFFFFFFKLIFSLILFCSLCFSELWRILWFIGCWSYRSGKVERTKWHIRFIFKTVDIPGCSIVH